MQNKKQGIRHLVECNCYLPTQKNKSGEKIIFHGFPVFSIIDEKDNVVPKTVQCNNCNAIHSVDRICGSKIIVGEEVHLSQIQKEEISLMIPSKLSKILEINKCELTIWEEVLFCFQEKEWNKRIVIVNEHKNKFNKRVGKVLIIKSSQDFEIELFEIDNFVTGIR